MSLNLKIGEIVSLRDGRRGRVISDEEKFNQGALNGAYYTLDFGASKETFREDRLKRLIVANQPENTNSNKMDKQKIAAAASMMGPEGMAVGAVISAKDAQDKAKIQKKQEELLKKQKEGEEAKLKALRDGGRAIGGSGSGGSRIGQEEIIFYFALIIHLIDGLVFGFARNGSALKFMLTIYIIYGVCIFTMYNGENGTKRSIVIAIVAAILIPVFFLEVPFMAALLEKSTFALATTGLLLALPIVPLYTGLIFSDIGKIHSITNFYVTAWIIFGLIIMIATFNTAGTGKALVVHPGESLAYIGQYIIWEPIKSTVKTGQDAWNKAIAQATGQPYGGDEESRVGIYIDKVEPLESKYYASSEDVIVTAKISAINVKEPMNLNVHCRIDGVREGTALPEILTDVVGNYENVVECRFGKLKAGSYTAKVLVDFKFESTSDITYTFVSKELKPDQYSDLKIDERVVATYTGGPVELGLPSLTQPLRIETDPDFKQSSYPFGISLDNKWTQGKIVRGVNYTLDVPQEVTLENCSRNPSHTYEPAAGTERNKYEFNMSTTNAQEAFDAIRCQMNFKDINSLLGIDLKSEKTFAGIANYEYQVEGSTTIIIEKN